MELEQSLRMLVSLRKASESMASQKRKSRLTLLEDGEEDDKDNTGSKEKQKKIGQFSHLIGFQRTGKAMHKHLCSKI